jgi:hypothetical protein
MSRAVTVETFASLAARIQSLPTSTAPRLVAIDGPSGAGKSTFARRLGRALGDPPIVAMDDFVSWDNLAGWWPRFEEQVLGPLLEGRGAHYQQRDWDNDPHGERLGTWRAFPTSAMVVLEGITSSRQPIAERLIQAIWIDAPRDLRLSRGVDRDGESMRPRWLNWMEREDTFFAQDGTRQRANLIVDGAPSTPHDPDHEYIADRIQPRQNMGPPDADVLRPDEPTSL